VTDTAASSAAAERLLTAEEREERDRGDERDQFEIPLAVGHRETSGDSRRRRRVLGTDHPDTITAEHNLATVYERLGVGLRDSDVAQTTSQPQSISSLDGGIHAELTSHIFSYFIEYEWRSKSNAVLTQHGDYRLQRTDDALQ
jgi:hypothetical protein